MAEEVNTGGLHRFVRSRGEELKLDDERRKDIREAYARAEEREAREKRNRMIFWIAGIILLALLILVGFLKFG